MIEDEGIALVNRDLVRAAFYSVIADAVFAALKVDGENVSGDYGKVWDACNDAATELLNGTCPVMYGEVSYLKGAQ